MRRSTRWGVIPMALVCLAFSESKLSYNQRQAVERQTRNLQEAQQKLDKLLTSYESETANLDGMIIPPSFYKGYLDQATLVETKCSSIESDLRKNDCPDGHPDVDALLDWVVEGRSRVDSFRAEVSPKLAEAEKLADPKNYPDLDADFERIEEIADTYRVNDLRWVDPDALETMVREFPNVTTFFSESYARYKPLIVVSGGKNSPLYKRYKWAAQPINEFTGKAQEFYTQAQTDYVAHLAAASDWADRAQREKKPLFFTGGVRQEMENAEQLVKLCCALLPEDDERRGEMWGEVDDVKARIARAEAELGELVLAAARVPGEKYDGSDKEQLRRRILEAWKKKWPADEVLATSFHMKEFDRSVEWRWQAAESSWYKSDHSVLAVTVVVKTDGRIATTYPAYVNVDHVDGTSDIGVNTKTGEYVHRQVLLENL